jgi:putative membrane protein
MDEANDPRVYFAAERTLLAWIRTGLAVIGLGFVVSRFGLFLRLMRDVPNAAPHSGSTWIGVGLVLLGSASIGLAAWQHLQFSRGLKVAGLPRPNTMRWSACFAALIALIGLALALYLLQGAGAL